MKTKLFIIGLLLIVVLGFVFYRSTIETLEITVTDKERVADEDKYLIFSEEEVFENTDAWLFLKFNSSDYYRKLAVGEEFEVRVVGWRVPFLSWYRNIIGVDGL